MEDLLFKGMTAGIDGLPRSRATSTARQGLKWLGRVGPGDVMALRHTDGDVFGKAVCLGVEKVTRAEVLDRALDNHANQLSDVVPNYDDARATLHAALERAYGTEAPDADYCIVHFIVINGNV